MKHVQLQLALPIDSEAFVVQKYEILQQNPEIKMVILGTLVYMLSIWGYIISWDTGIDDHWAAAIGSSGATYNEISRATYIVDILANFIEGSLATYGEDTLATYSEDTLATFGEDTVVTDIADNKNYRYSGPVGYRC